VLADGGDLGVDLRRVVWIAILQRAKRAVIMIHVAGAVWDIVHEQAPEMVSSNYRLALGLLSFNDSEEARQTIGIRLRSRPVILSCQVDLVSCSDEGDV